MVCIYMHIKKCVKLADANCCQETQHRLLFGSENWSSAWLTVLVLLLVAVPVVTTLVIQVHLGQSFIGTRQTTTKASFDYCPPTGCAVCGGEGIKWP